MHVGNLRTALYAYLITKHEGGDFILRIEDTDQERYVEGAVDIIYRTLEKTGLIHDEGPDKDGGFGPYVQSERQATGMYLKYAKQLIEQGDAYYCFCGKEELESIQDVLGSYHTDFGTVVNGRTNNIKTGASKLDGLVVYPGETISVSEAIGPTTAENGYYPAGSYENGTTVETYGGGICQVSTTLYNAVIRAELEIVTRAAHSMIVSYVEPSMDAAIADGIKDLQFKNNQETPIYIEGYTSGGIIYFNIYGKETRPSNRRVDFVSEVTSQTEPEKEYVAVGDQPVGYIETTTKPHIGYTARLWKIVYENDVEVSRKVFNNSKYNPSKEVISVGVGGATPEAAAAINAAIATKDDATIRATVANYTPEAQAAAAQAAADAAAAQAAAAAAAQQQQQQTQTTTTPSAAGTPAGTTTGATPGTTSGTAQ